MRQDLRVLRDRYIKRAIELDAELSQLLLSFFVQLAGCDGDHTILPSPHSENTQNVEGLPALTFAFQCKLIATVTLVGRAPHIGIALQCCNFAFEGFIVLRS